MTVCENLDESFPKCPCPSIQYLNDFQVWLLGATLPVMITMPQVWKSSSILLVAASPGHAGVYNAKRIMNTTVFHTSIPFINLALTHMRLREVRVFRIIPAAVGTIDIPLDAPSILIP